jgi:hypothetical protein
MIMHELCLKETWVNNGIDYSEITHKEFHIIDINEDDESEVISKKMDAKIKYRPICMKGGLNYRATIIDTIKIINTVDSSSYEVMKEIQLKEYITNYSSLCVCDEHSFVYVNEGTFLQISSEDGRVLFHSKGGRFNGQLGGILPLEGGKYFAIENSKRISIIKPCYA